MGATDDLRKIGHCDVAGLQKKMSYDAVSGSSVTQLMFAVCNSGVLGMILTCGADFFHWSVLWRDCRALA
ncbi:hypothetical protein DPMN_020546 [Dreissena polymorpha]|uniref:Uncharacterized protein n=1 Tax=Dreissena polymorpha TaxID=45954 RepID=A0A9D4SAB7_DREPO|nr:hypothetical protein DPMN_020546 [Dreissena polymorpha]